MSYNLSTLLQNISLTNNIDYKDILQKLSNENIYKAVDDIDPFIEKKPKKITLNFFEKYRTVSTIKKTNTINLPEKKEPNTFKSKKKKINDKQLIKTYKILYENEYYLIDDNNNVYTFNITQPKIVGIKLIDKTIKFY
jgi:hypothetical protein